MARSAPKLNKPIPRIRKNAEIKKTAISFAEKLTKGVKFKSTTMATTGRTETNDSFNFFIKTPPKSSRSLAQKYFPINYIRIHTINQPQRMKKE